jgi:polyhydroxybutyrate depolymerase
MSARISVVFAIVVGIAACGDGNAPAHPPDAGISTDVAPISGCRAATWPMVGLANPKSIDVTDATGTTLTRQFYVALPDDYDPTQLYRLIFAWHYYGDTAFDLANSDFYGIPPLLPDAIYVAGQGLPDSTGMNGWANANGRDIAFTRAMIAWMESAFCVDPARIMSTGMSYGGQMTDLIGCQMPDVFRALGVMSGSLTSFGPAYCISHEVAAWITHGTADTMIDISLGETALYQFLADNHCASTSQAVDPSPCVSYDGCDTGYPVVWCPVVGEGHAIPSFAAAGIASFFGQF